MKRHALATTLALALGFLFATSGLQADDRDHHPCSNRKVAGDWGYTATGTRTGVGPVAAVGSFTLDADGNILNGQQTISFNGLIAGETLSGTYTLNEDCTGTVVVNVVSPILNRTSHMSFVDVNDVNESRMIFTDPGTIITIEARRISSR